MLTLPSPTRYNWPALTSPSGHCSTSVKRTIKPELRSVAGREDNAWVRRVSKGLIRSYSIW